MGWAALKAAYFVVGGIASLALAPELVRRSGRGDAGFEPVSCFVIVFGVVMLWPVLVPLLFDRGGPR